MPRTEPYMTVAAPAWRMYAVAAALSVIGFALFWVVGVLFLVLALYILYFFRDPRRSIPQGAGDIASPADGKVVSVLEVPCPQMPGGRARRVAIFLNIFDVHLQRSPVAGVVREVVHRPGKCLNALNEKCSEENEQTTIWLDSEDGVFGVRQISGAIARRIVCRAKEGDRLARGQRYGLIQFGSRVELFLPLEAEVLVRPGQRVQGGATRMASMRPDTGAGGEPGELAADAAE